MVDRKNAEGYTDPTTYEALTNIESEKKAAQRAALSCLADEYRPLVYVCSPYRGNVSKNVENAQRYFCCFIYILC